MSPGLLEPAGFTLQGSAKTVVIAFGAVFAASGLAAELALFMYFRDTKRAADIARAAPPSPVREETEEEQVSGGDDEAAEDLEDEDFDE
ncbi:MAG: hypothetical protein HY720_00925 [Planctomycetes bacterium]|nr:hypothetical protein [Planctomycetota bacterium]